MEDKSTLRNQEAQKGSKEYLYGLQRATRMRMSRLTRGEGGFIEEMRAATRLQDGLHSSHAVIYREGTGWGV